MILQCTVVFSTWNKTWELLDLLSSVCLRTFIMNRNYCSKLNQFQYDSADWGILTCVPCVTSQCSSTIIYVIWLLFQPLPVLSSVCFFCWLVGCVYVPLTARSFRDDTPIFCPLRRTRSSVCTLFSPGIKPRAVAWQSIALPLRHTSSLFF